MIEKHDRWSKAEIISKITSALILPIVLLVIANTYNKQQQETEILRNKAENSANRLTTMLKSLSSENPKERELAIRVAEFFSKNDQLPNELIPVLLSIASSDPNKDVSSEARQSLKNMAKENKSLASVINEGLTILPQIVYIQIANENQREKAQKLQADLRKNGYSAPGIENVGDEIGSKPTLPQNTEVRYFNVEDKNHVEKIIGILKSNGFQNVSPVPIRLEKTEPIEIWFSPND